MNRIKTYLAGIFCLFLVSLLSAQGPAVGNDYLASTGKIYVVVAVILIIFIGIIALLISLERRLARLEQESREENQ